MVERACVPLSTTWISLTKKWRKKSVLLVYRFPTFDLSCRMPDLNSQHATGANPNQRPIHFVVHSFWRMRLGACTRHFTRQYIIKTMTSLSMLTLLCLYFLYFSLFLLFFLLFKHRSVHSLKNNIGILCWYHRAKIYCMQYEVSTDSSYL